MNVSWRRRSIVSAASTCSINNAGIGEAMAVEDEPLDRFRTAMEVNVTAVWHLSKLSAPSMIERGGGAIVNIASMLGHVGSTPVKQAHYCASKGAVVNLTRELALQWARKGITVNALCPGWFPSEMTAGMETDEGSQQFIQTNSPIPRMGELHELDGALLLLAGRIVPDGPEHHRRRRLDRRDRPVRACLTGAMKKFLQEYKEFINKGDVIVVAVGLVMACTSRRSSTSSSRIITPLIALIFGEASLRHRFHDQRHVLPDRLVFSAIIDFVASPDPVRRHQGLQPVQGPEVDEEPVDRDRPAREIRDSCARTSRRESNVERRFNGRDPRSPRPRRGVHDDARSVCDHRRRRTSPPIRSRWRPCRRWAASVFCPPRWCPSASR